MLKKIGISISVGGVIPMLVFMLLAATLLRDTNSLLPTSSITTLGEFSIFKALRLMEMILGFGLGLAILSIGSVLFFIGLCSERDSSLQHQTANAVKGEDLN